MLTIINHSQDKATVHDCEDEENGTLNNLEEIKTIGSILESSILLIT